MEAESTTRNSTIEESSSSIQDDDESNAINNNSERELTITHFTGINLSSEENMFCVDDIDQTNESTFLLSKSLATQHSEYNAINPTPMTVSVIVHSPDNINPT